MIDRRLAVATALLAAACAGQRPAAPATPAPARQGPAPAPPAAAPSLLRYAAGASRYRLEQATHVVQDIMGQVSEVDVSVRQLLSTTATAAAGNLVISLTVDSIDVTGPPGADGGITAARGRTFRLVLDPSGLAISAAASDSTDPVLRQIAAGMHEFFPKLPSGPVTAGQTWTDTVTHMRTVGGDVTTRSVRQHRVVGWEDRDGARALHIETTSSYTVSGSTEAQGQSVDLSGGGQSVRDSFVSAAGVFLGAVERDSALVNANVAAMGLTVPVRQTRRGTVTRLP